jgi:superfamily I DNA and/or RNA helicase
MPNFMDNDPLSKIEISTRKAILKYFKNCIEEDSKEALKIDINNTSQIFIPTNDTNEFVNYLWLPYKIEEKSDFYRILWVNISWFTEEFLIWFYLKSKINFDNSKYSAKQWWNYELNWYIKFETNWLRWKLLNDLSAYQKILKLDLLNLEKEDLQNLFFSPDKWSKGISKIDYKPNLDFLNFYDNNKNESFYIVLEYIKTGDQNDKSNTENSRNIITPLYLIGIEIVANSNGSFSISLKESEPDFLYNIKNSQWKSIFPFYSENRWDEWTSEAEKLENNIRGLTTYRDKIDYYKDHISSNIDKEKEILVNPCIISGKNSIKMIKDLISDYNWLIQNDKAMEDLSQSSLWLLFKENSFHEDAQIKDIICITELNVEQEIIIKKSLEQNISVIIWPPWTWKSQIVLNLLANIYNQNKTVIFASKNNTAVDTVIEKLEKMDFPYLPFLRLGNRNSTELWSNKILVWLNHERSEIKKFTIKDVNKEIEKIQEIQQEVSKLEKGFINYYNSYLAFELKLTEIDDKEIKENIYQLFPRVQGLWKYKNKLKTFLQVLEYRKYTFTNFSNKTNLPHFLENNETENQDLLKTFNKIQKWIIEIHEQLEDVDLEDYFKKWNISPRLKKILNQGYFIQYSSQIIKDLQKTRQKFKNIQEYGPIWKFFFWKWHFNKHFNFILDIFNQQPNDDIRYYLLDLDMISIDDFTSIDIKIKEIIYLYNFESKYFLKEKCQKELKKYMKEKEELLNSLLDWFWENFIFSDFDSLWDDLHWIILLKEYLTTVKLLKNELLQDLWDELYWFFNSKFHGDLWVILTIIITLHDLSIKKWEIDALSRLLQSQPKNTNILSQDIIGHQEKLKNISINYLSSKIIQAINWQKATLKDSIDWIYNAYSKLKKNAHDKDFNNKKSIFLKEKFGKIFWKINIFVTTNQSTYNLPLEKWFFDYLIIDEASQNDLASIIPLMFRCKRVIIIWDPNQLQNITKIKEEAARNIFNQKLKEIDIDPLKFEVDFKQIYNYGNSKNYWLSAFGSLNHLYNWTYNQETMRLHEHYRCHPDIINFSNILIGNYNLFPKSYIKNDIINPNITPLGIHWMKNIQARDKEKTNQNEEEAKQIILYLKELLGMYGDKVSIGIISPYRNQVNLLNAYLRNEGLSDYKNVLINTVHRFQWDEKDIIMYSPVFPKSNLWNERNLLNVAVSRAKSCFYIFGDKTAISNAKDENWLNLLGDLIKYTDVIGKQQELTQTHKFDSKYEEIFYSELKKAWIQFDFHVQENKSQYELDFKLKLKWFNQYINIELDGDSHSNKKSYDYTRNILLEKLWYQVIRYSNTYMLNNIGDIIANLSKICEVNVKACPIG